MPLLVIWLITSFAIRLLVVHFRLIILLRSRAKARFRGGAPKAERAGETSSRRMQTPCQTDARADDLLPARIVFCGWRENAETEDHSPCLA